MERLADRVRIGGREYRIIEDLETGAIRIVSAAGSQALPDRTVAYQLISKLYRSVTADYKDAIPGADIVLPMADGTTKTVTVMTVTNADITVVDKETGEQMTLPKTKGQPTVSQPAPVQQSQTPGVVMQGPGYGTTQGRKTLFLSRRMAGAGDPKPDASATSTGRKLSRHEIVQEAETLIRNAMAKGAKIGLEELTNYLAEQYSNQRDELYAGAKMAWDKVQWEGDEPGAGGPPSLEDIAAPAIGE